MAPKRVLSRHPSRGMLIGLDSWHAEILSADQNLSCHSPYCHNPLHLGVANSRSPPGKWHYFQLRIPRRLGLGRSVTNQTSDSP